MKQMIYNYFCLKILNTSQPKNFRQKISDTGFVRKYQCPKISEHFNTVVNFTICKKLKILKVSENKNAKLQSFDHRKHEKQAPVWFF